MTFQDDLPPPEDPVGRGLAVTCYGLIIASFFTAWITGFVAWGMALFNRRAPDPVARSHFRFALKIVEIGGLIGALGIVAMLFAGWRVVATLWNGDGFDWSLAGQAGGLLVLGGLMWGGSIVGSLAAAAFGLIRLVSGEPMGRR